MPVYLFDTSEKVWENISSSIVPLTWDRYKAQESQMKHTRSTKTASDPPAESGSRQVFSDTQSKSAKDSLFGTDQEVDKPTLSKLIEIDLSETNSSSGAAETEVPPPKPTVTTTEDKTLHQKVDTLISLVSKLKASQNQEALVKQISELKKRVSDFEKKKILC